MQCKSEEDVHLGFSTCVDMGEQERECLGYFGKWGMQSHLRQSLHPCPLKMGGGDFLQSRNSKEEEAIATFPAHTSSHLDQQKLSRTAKCIVLLSK